MSKKIEDCGYSTELVGHTMARAQRGPNESKASIRQYNSECELIVYGFGDVRAERTSVSPFGAGWSVSSLTDRFTEFRISLPTGMIVRYVRDFEARQNCGRAA